MRRLALLWDVRIHGTVGTITIQEFAVADRLKTRNDGLRSMREIAAYVNDH